MKKFFGDLGFFVLASLLSLIFVLGGVSLAHWMRNENIFIVTILFYIVVLGPVLVEYFRNKCIQKESGRWFTGICVVTESLIAIVIWQVDPMLAVLQIVSRIVHVGFYLSNKYVGWKRALKEQAIFNALTLSVNMFLSSNIFTAWIFFVSVYYGRRIYKRKEIFNIV